jgi:7-cyano-7-deazaguanine synthase
VVNNNKQEPDMAVDSVVIVSGGMDSVTLLHHLVKQENRKPAVISFRYGQKHVKEIEYARKNVAGLGLDAHQVVDLAPIQTVFQTSALVDSATAIPTYEAVQGDPQPATYVPNRNMLFLAIAVAYAETLNISEVFYGAQRHDIYGYWDTTPDFLMRLNDVYQLNRKTPVRIRAPFVEYSKADILRIGFKLNVDYGATWSCYRGSERACGECPTCQERLIAFREVGAEDPLPYENQA